MRAELFMLPVWLTEKKGVKSGLESCCTAYAMSFSSKVSRRRGGKSPLGASLKPAMPGDASTRFKMRSDPYDPYDT
jgi:hypothetical protein